MSPRIKVLSLAALATLAGAGIWYGTKDSNSQPNGVTASQEVPAQAEQASPTPSDSTDRLAASNSSPDSPANRCVRVRRLSGRAYAVEDFGQVPSGTVDQVIAKLSPLALAGDAAASYGIFLKLNECANISRRAARGSALGASPQVAAACADLSVDNEISSGKWLALAAEQGNIGARLLYAADSESAVGGPAEMLRNQDRVKEYKETAVGYLNDLASQGSVDALLQLGNAYHAGVLIDEDPITSRAYFEAVRLADPKVVPDQQVSALDKRLSAQQLSQALRKGNQILDSCCR